MNESMKTLEQRIAEIEKDAIKHLSEDFEIPYGDYDDAFWTGCERGSISTAKEALSIIQELQEENSKLKDLIKKEGE